MYFFTWVSIEKKEGEIILYYEWLLNQLRKMIRLFLYLYFIKNSSENKLWKDQVLAKKKSAEWGKDDGRGKELGRDLWDWEIRKRSWNRIKVKESTSDCTNTSSTTNCNTSNSTSRKSWVISCCIMLRLRLKRRRDWWCLCENIISWR